MSNIAVPYFLEHLKISERGFVIPFFVSIVNGKPDFRLLDRKKQELCVNNKLCGICGKKLYEYQYVIGGTLTLSNMICTDPPMHRECAEYSLSVCPHLYFQKAHRNETGKEYKLAKESSVISEKLSEMPKPDKILLIKINRFRWHKMDNRFISIRPVSLDTYVYENNKLIREFR